MYYSLGVDGISIPLILLTTVITVLVVIAGWGIVPGRIAEYFASFLILEGLMIGVFCALDAILFYIFFEGMLIPMFLIIGIWGGPRRVYATDKVLLVYLFRFDIPAGGTGLSLPAGQYLRNCTVAAVSSECPRTILDLPGIPDCVCGQDTHVACTYLVAGCTRRGPYGRFGGIGGLSC